LAVNENVRAWPGGTGGHKLGLNYAPGFLPQREAAKKGYDQILWLLEDRITEVGAMNVFVVVKRDDGGELRRRNLAQTLQLTGLPDIDVFTPPLDGTILPGVTRSSVIELLNAHGSSAASLPGISQKTYVQERTITMPEIKSWSDAGRLLEIFGCGTAVVVAPVGRIGYSAWGDEEVVLPEHDGGHGPIGKAVCTRLTDIQTGKSQFDGWSVPVA
jgi:branched-chain amino acid aminotransferase